MAFSPQDDESPPEGGGPLMFQNLRRLINVVDELRDVGLHQFIALPRICVVGTQSAGKSSVLESIVGIDFLPRGEGVVTRRPLELRLVHTVRDPLGEESEKKGGIRNGFEDAYAVFENKPKDKVHDFEVVRQTIERLTEERAGGRKGIVDDPIVLTIYGPSCPDLTLIDLPGITRVPLKNSDQTDDIERVTREMALRYAADPRTIILAVVPANQDMSTSDALQLARRVDPRGVRTIGVLTKIDLMDRGTDAARMLMGEDVPLRLGFTGVRNRSQADIVARRTISDALATEKEFFVRHPKYRLLPANMVGTPALVSKLTRVLFRHIKLFLPEIKREIHQRLKVVQTRLATLGEGVPLNAEAQVQLMWSLIGDYCDVFSNSIRGKFDKKLQNYFWSNAGDDQVGGHQSCGSEIRQIFNELLSDAASCTASLSDYDIDVAIRKHEGDSLPGFPSPDTFESLIVPYLRQIHGPVMECLDRVAAAMENLAGQSGGRVFKRFPQLMEQVLDLATESINREKERTRSILEDFVTAETGYLFTNDDHYLTQHGSMIPMTDTDGRKRNQNGVAATPPAHEIAVSANPLSEDNSNAVNLASTMAGSSASLYNSLQGVVTSMWQHQQSRPTHYSPAFIAEIRARLDAYFAIVVRNVRDSGPKIIGCFLVRTLQEKLQFELHSKLNKSDKFSELLGEPPHIRSEREALAEQAKVLQRASAVLLRDPGITGINGEEFDETFDADLATLSGITGSSNVHPNPNSQQQLQTGGQHRFPVPHPTGPALHSQAIPQARQTPTVLNQPPQPAQGTAGGRLTSSSGGVVSGMGSLFNFGTKKSVSNQQNATPLPPQQLIDTQALQHHQVPPRAGTLFERRHPDVSSVKGLFNDPVNVTPTGNSNNNNTNPLFL